MRIRAWAAVAVAFGGVSAALAGGPYYWSGNGHYYDVIHDDTLTWEQARDLAGAMTYNDGFNDYAGYLATITTQDENDWLRGTVDVVGMYLGGEHMGGAAGNYGWITGESWTAFDAGHWAGGEPNGDSGGLQYAWTGEDGFNDLLRNQNYGSLTPGYVVEFELVPEPASLAVLAAGALFVFRRRKS